MSGKKGKKGKKMKKPAAATEEVKEEGGWFGMGAVATEEVPADAKTTSGKAAKVKTAKVKKMKAQKSAPVVEEVAVSEEMVEMPAPKKTTKSTHRRVLKSECVGGNCGAE
jgi:hypothetical protein